MVSYSVKGKTFSTENEALKAWDKLENNQYYSVFEEDGDRTVKLNVGKINISKLDDMLKKYNSVEVYYKKSNKVYCYRSTSKINFKDLDYIVLMELRGRMGHIEKAIRVQCVKNDLYTIQ